MVYSNKFVMCVLVDGKPSKELANGVVKIPFNSEYSLRFRNKYSNRRAVVNIYIDGENVSGNGYIVPANSFVDIERWYDKPIKFKFVSLDSEEAVDYGKNGPNDDKVKGTIEARFRLEKEQTYTPLNVIHHFRPTRYYRKSVKDFENNPSDYYSCNTVGLRGMNVNCDTNPYFGVSSNYPVTDSLPVMDGCTVEGNHSNQHFTSVPFEAEEDYVSLKIFLQGLESPNVTVPTSQSSNISQKLLEAQVENKRLRDLLKQKELEKTEALELAQINEENRKLLESLNKTNEI